MTQNKEVIIKALEFYKTKFNSIYELSDESKEKLELIDTIIMEINKN